jgi:hypothetical protein
VQEEGAEAKSEVRMGLTELRTERVNTAGMGAGFG